MTLSINGKTYEAGELIAYVEKLENENAELKKQLKTVKEMCCGKVFCPYRSEISLNEYKKALEQPNECHDCAKFDEMPKGPRCKTCDNGSHFQKKEEA